MALREDYNDAVFAGLRKYKQLENGDGTISLVDVTEYVKAGDKFGAKEVNAITGRINSTGEDFQESQDYEEGDYAIYDNRVQRFIAAHPAGTWDASHAEKTTILQELVNQNKDIGGLTERIGNFRYGEETDSETGEVTRGYYVYDEEAGTDVLVPFKNGSGNKIRRVYRTNSSGTSATYDLTGIDGYEKLTLADIGTIHPRGRTQNTIDGKGELHTSAITKTYDAATGILTINQSDAQGNFLMYSFAELYVVIKPTFSCTVKALETTISGNRTFDLTFIDGWEDINISQYSFFPSSFSRSNYNLGGDVKSAMTVLYYTLSYDNSTGILTLVRDAGNTAEAADFSIELFSNF